MRFARFILFLVRLGAVLSCWAAASVDAQTNPDRQLQLQVVDNDSGQPVVGVRIRAWVRGEMETDSAGHCSFPLPAPKSDNFYYRITLSKAGYVPRYITWSKAQQDTIDGMPTNYTAHLAHGVGIGGVVKNEKGEPIPGAKVIFSGPPPSGVEREKTWITPNYHSERADEQGRWTNSEIPADFKQMTFRVTDPEYVPATFSCAPSDDDSNLIVLSESDFRAGTAVMTLGHGIVAAGRVLDPDGHPVAGAIVTKDFEWRNPAVTRETDENGGFALLNLRPGEMILTVQSREWAPQTVPVTLTNGLPELTIRLKPGRALLGRVVDEAGKPISGARIQLDRVGREPLEFDWSTETDDGGAFAWPAAPEGEHPYVVAAPGFHARSETAWATGGPDKTAVLRHEKEGDGVEVDGLVIDAATSQPLPKFTLHLTEYHGGAVITSEQEVATTNGRYRVSIDAKDAAFVLSVRAGGYLPAQGDRQLAGDGDQSVDFELNRGAAREVTGRFVVNNYNDWIDWTNGQEISLSAVVPKPPGLEGNDAEADARLMRDFLHTREGRKWRQAQSPQAVEVDARGFFKIVDVAPGKHELRAQLLQTAPQGGGPIGMLSKQIDVPEAASGSDAAFYLGTVEITARHDLGPGDAAPDFAVKSLDGAPLKLADYRGKYVLLDFWATWCGPCVGEMPNLKAVYDAFGHDGRFVMISLSLDRDASAPKAFARKNGVKWLQGFLGEWSATDVPNQYGVDGIPAIFLIGPDGKIIDHGLRGPAVGEAVKRALNTPN